MTIENMIETYGKMLYNYALRLTCHPSAAEDLTQETFLKAWLHHQKLNSEAATGAWLKKICYNCFLMALRKEKGVELLLYDEFEKLEQEGRLLDLQEGMPTVEDEILVDEAVKSLQNGCFLAMARRLSVDQRIAFSLVDMFGLRIEEVAAMLGISKGAVKGLLYRARMNLDSFFGDHCQWIEVKNPCRCQAWVDFASRRSDHERQAAEKRLVTSLNYKEKGYVFSPVVRAKVRQLYEAIPEYKPPEAWYQQVITSLGEKDCGKA